MGKIFGNIIQFIFREISYDIKVIDVIYVNCRLNKLGNLEYEIANV